MQFSSENGNVRIGSPGNTGSVTRIERERNENRARARVSTTRRRRSPSPQTRRVRRRISYNSNTNNNNVGQIRPRRLYFGDNGNNRPNASNYIKNEKRMKKNANENKKTNKIKWRSVTVKNLPIDPISTNSFKKGNKAVKINKLYLAPNSFRKMARVSMASATNANGNTTLFINPLTRGKVKKNDLKFVVLKTKK